jgi:hypothetical protein
MHIVFVFKLFLGTSYTKILASLFLLVNLTQKLL